MERPEGHIVAAISQSIVLLPSTRVPTGARGSARAAGWYEH